MYKCTYFTSKHKNILYGILFALSLAAGLVVCLAILLVAFLIGSLEFGSCLLDLIFKLGLQLLLCQALGLEINLLLLQVVFHLILEKLDIIIKLSMLNGSAIMSQSTHLVRENIDSLRLDACIILICICLDIKNAIEDMSIYNSISNYLYLLKIISVIADCRSHLLSVLLSLGIHCLLLLSDRITRARCQSHNCGQ